MCDITVTVCVVRISAMLNVVQWIDLDRERRKMKKKKNEEKNR